MYVHFIPFHPIAVTRPEKRGPSLVAARRLTGKKLGKARPDRSTPFISTKRWPKSKDSRLPQKSNTTMASIRKQELSLLKQRDLICSIPTPIIDRPAQDHHDTVCGISKSQGMNLSAEQCGKYPHSISQFISDPRGVNHHCKLPHVQRKSVVVVPHSSRLGNAIQKVIAVAVVQGIVSLSSSSSSSSSFLFAVTSNSCCLIDVTW
jgi:hypothetical protein